MSQTTGKQGKLHQIVAVSDFEQSSTIKSSKCNIDGRPWNILVQRNCDVTDNKAYLGVYLVLISGRCLARFVVRLPSMKREAKLSGDDTTVHDFGGDGGRTLGFDLIDWETLVDPANGYVDGNARFVLEIDVTIGEPPAAVVDALPIPTIDSLPSITKPPVARITQNMKADMFVSVHGRTFKCHKVIMAEHCVAIADALRDRNSILTRFGRFNMSNEYATLETVPLFVRTMYDPWKSATMDRYARELLRLAKAYRAKRVAEMAASALERLLKPTRFWDVFQVAVDTRHEGLMQFAVVDPDRMWFARGSPADPSMHGILAAEIAQLTTN